MSEKPSSIDLYRSSKEHITIDPVYCYGVLDNKHFLVMRETQGDNNVYIRWQKNQNTRFSGQNVFGLRAEKLLKLILSKIQNSPMAQETIEQMKIMIEKNKKATEYYVVKQHKKEDPQPVIKSEEQLKREREFKKFMENKDRFAAQNEERKKKKEAEKLARTAQKEEEKRKRQEAAQKRIQEQRILKELKDQEQAYLKMMRSTEDKNPVVIIANETNIILGYLNNKFYRIKMDDNNSSFYSVSEKKLEPMDIETFQNIIVSIDENLNQNGQFDNLLTQIVSAYGAFTSSAQSVQKDTLRERVAIGKNILIQKGILTPQNSL
ncbi:MAG: hypothetical protein J6V53_01760 [Alphaproteobacteria bacterium]|nr:hypothetical protein [Alphaproteobacteria bacterium]